MALSWGSRGVGAVTGAGADRRGPLPTSTALAVGDKMAMGTTGDTTATGNALYASAGDIRATGDVSVSSTGDIRDTGDVMDISVGDAVATGEVLDSSAGDIRDTGDGLDRSDGDIIGEGEGTGDSSDMGEPGNRLTEGTGKTVAAGDIGNDGDDGDDARFRISSRM